MRMVACVLAFIAYSSVTAIQAQDAKKKDQAAAFSFGDVEYFHRFTTKDQHEYTPAGQDDLEAWTEMVTIHFYRDAKDGDALAAIANGVLENYKKAKGRVAKTESVPRTKDKPAEHLIVVAFGRPEFIEVAFARFRMYEGVGTSVIYSRRTYGKKVDKETGAWLEKNAATTEKTLMKWDAMPKLPEPK